MKAILLYDKMFMGIIDVGGITPTIKLPISKTLSGMFNEAESPYPKDNNMVVMEFKIVEFGKEYLVYQLNGFI